MLNCFTTRNDLGSATPLAIEVLKKGTLVPKYQNPKRRHQCSFTTVRYKLNSKQPIYHAESLLFIMVQYLFLTAVATPRLLLTVSAVSNSSLSLLCRTSKIVVILLCLTACGQKGALYLTQDRISDPTPNTETDSAVASQPSSSANKNKASAEPANGK